MSRILEIIRDAFLRKQYDRCAICEKDLSQDSRAAVDHDHQSGRIRAVLCATCNSLLGMAHDSQKILYAAIDYLNHDYSENPIHPEHQPDDPVCKTGMYPRRRRSKLMDWVRWATNERKKLISRSASR